MKAWSAEVSPMPVILGVALAVRLAVALTFWNVVATDEVYQYLEQAHRLVFGQGIVPWEYLVGLRCWLIPLLLAGPMAMARLVDPDPLAGLALIRVLLCVASLPIVWAAVRWGEDTHGRSGAWVAGLLTAFWPDLWLMAPHPLEETLAADALVPAVYLVTLRPTRMATVSWTGFLLGLAFALRMQLAPAIAVAGLALCGQQPRRWLAALPAAALPVLAAGLLDWLSWGQPFRSFWLNIDLNMFRGLAAHEFGRDPPGYFLNQLALDWLWTLPAVAILAWRGARTLRLPGLLTLAILLTHSLIGHKEYRFVFPALALAIPLAGVGLTPLLQAPGRARHWAVVGLALAGPLCSPFLYVGLTSETGTFRLFRVAAIEHPTLVSVQGWRPDIFFPLDILFDDRTRLTPLTIAPGGEADAVIATASAPLPAGFTRHLCEGGDWLPFAPSRAPTCLFTRKSATTASSGISPPVLLIFPAEAQAFRIQDRLF